MLDRVEREKLKKAVRSFGRLRIAEIIGMPYPTLGVKLNGFATITDAEVARIKKAISSVKKGLENAN